MSEDPYTVLNAALEPASLIADDRNGVYGLVTPLHSIAISLKRIADALERPPLHRETEGEVQDYLDRLASSYGVGP